MPPHRSRFPGLLGKLQDQFVNHGAKNEHRHSLDPPHGVERGERCSWERWLPAVQWRLAASLPVSTGYADVPGGKVYWRRFGSGDKTPLLMLHGGPGPAHNYLLSMAALADERPVIFYDQLGCGSADAPAVEGIYTIQRSVDEITLDCHETIRDGIAGNGQLAVMAGCSHMTMVEQPEKYNALVRSFLDET